ncbi:MAG: hypothetical protein R3E32_02785 [Chitinophagales bacterium]
MKLASKLMLSCLMLLLGVSSIYAQKANHKFGDMNPEEKAKKHSERMTEQLGLSDAQANKVYSINLEYSQKAKSLFDGTADKEAAKEKMKELRTSQKAAIEAVLTPAQLTKLQTLEAERKANRGEHKGGFKGGKKGGHANMNPEERAQKHTQKMTEELGLSTTQASQIQSILLQYGNRKKVLWENSTDKEATKASMKDLMKSQKAAIEAVLTPAQITKMEALKAEHKAQRGEHKGGKRGSQK